MVGVLTTNCGILVKDWKDVVFESETKEVVGDESFLVPYYYFSVMVLFPLSDILIVNQTERLLSYYARKGENRCSTRDRTLYHVFPSDRNKNFYS